MRIFLRGHALEGIRKAAMHRNSLGEYVRQYIIGHGRGVAFLHGRAAAFLQHSGYRTLRASYAEIAGLAAQCARELERRGIQPEERVLLWGRNSAEWVAGFLGCVLRGAVAVPLDQASSPEFVARVAKEVEPKLVLADHGNVLPGGNWPLISFQSLGEATKGNSNETYASPPLHRNSIAEIIFTSGATSEPKGVVITHGNLLANLEPLEAAMQPYLKWERFVHPLRFLDLVPLSHVFGQFMGIWVPPLVGACVHFQDSLNPTEVISTIRKERVSVLVSVPRVLEAVRGKIERELEAEGKLEAFQREFEAAANEKFLRRMWRFRRLHRRFGWNFWAVVSGGATLDPELERFWSRIGLATIQGYGLTETSSLVTVNHPFRIGRGSVGKALHGREVRLDESGEILVRGENVAAGYWEGREIRPVMSGVGSEEWFHTGDLGALDAEGNLYFKGRKKNVIVTAAGMNVYPEDVEALLRREPEVKDCVVIGLERNGNEEPCGVLLLREERRVKQPRHAAGIVARVNESLAEYQRMRSWFLWPDADFPRTATGKPKIAEIRSAVEAQGGKGARGNWRAPASGITELIAKIRGGGNLAHTEASLENELRLTSLDRVELLSALEDRYQVDLNETKFAEAKTVGDLEALVRGPGQARSEFVFPRWAQSWPVTWIRSLCYSCLTWPATHLMAHPHVSGRENLRSVKSPVLVICNHVIYLDVGFVLAALPGSLRRRLAVAMGGERLEEMRRPPKEWFFLRRWHNRMNYFLAAALFNVFPLPKRSGFRESFRFAGDLADRGWSVLVFPEGDLTPDGKLQPFRAGIGLLAHNLKIPVVPMRIDGAYEVRQEKSLFNRPGRIRIYIGKPMEFSEATDPQEITRSLEGRVAELGQPKEQKEIAKSTAAGGQAQ